MRLERATEELTSELARAPTPAELAERLDASVEEVLDALATATAHRPIALDRPAGDEDGPPRAVAAQQEEGYARVEDADEFESLLERLPERERVPVELRFRHDLLQREIAERLGISQMQVSRLIARGVRRLRELTSSAREPALLAR
jgi:RNA polymerase sigma-B factor